MKKSIALCFLVFAAACVQAQTLSWDIKLYQLKTMETHPIDENIAMKSGDDFSISITPASDCYGYVLVFDFEDNIYVECHELLKGRIEKNIGPLGVPFKNGNARRTETYYVIMSLKEQTSLESLIKAYISNPNNRNNSNNLQKEIERLQGAVSSSGRQGSAFVQGMGTDRAWGSPGQYITPFFGQDLYVEPITIVY